MSSITDRILEFIDQVVIRAKPGTYNDCTNLAVRTKFITDCVTWCDGCGYIVNMTDVEHALSDIPDIAMHELLFPRPGFNAIAFIENGYAESESSDQDDPEAVYDSTSNIREAVLCVTWVLEAALESGTFMAVSDPSTDCWRVIVVVSWPCADHDTVCRKLKYIWNAAASTSSVAELTASSSGGYLKPTYVSSTLVSRDGDGMGVWASVFVYPQDPRPFLAFK